MTSFRGSLFSVFSLPLSLSLSLSPPLRGAFALEISGVDLHVSSVQLPPFPPTSITNARGFTRSNRNAVCTAPHGIGVFSRLCGVKPTSGHLTPEGNSPFHAVEVNQGGLGQPGTSPTLPQKGKANPPRLGTLCTMVVKSLVARLLPVGGATLAGLKANGF